MAVTYGFYDSLAGDRKYNAEQMSRIFEGIISEGVFATVGGGLVVTAAGGTMNISVATGRAWVANTWTLNDSALGLTVQASEAALNRIDTVVVEVNKDLGVRANSIKIIKGTPGSSPVAPTLANTATLKQIGLADIAVAAGVTQITQGNITNRIGTVDTPFVTGVIQTLDFSTLLGQFQSDFIQWLGNLQDQLDDNQAGNLQVQIDKLVLENNRGWIEVPNGSVAYNGVNTFGVATDATLKYQKGWKVRYKQGGAYKYAVMYTVAATTITIVPSIDYTLDNAAITDFAYSLEEAPHGFPQRFRWTPTVTYSGGTTDPTSTTITNAYWRVIGSEIFFNIFANQTRGSGNRTHTIFSGVILPPQIRPLTGFDSINGVAYKPADGVYMLTDGKIYYQKTMAATGEIHIVGNTLFT